MSYQRRPCYKCACWIKYEAISGTKSDAQRNPKYSIWKLDSLALESAKALRNSIWHWPWTVCLSCAYSNKKSIPSQTMFCYKLASGQFYKPNVFTLPIKTFNSKLTWETFNRRRGGSLKWGDAQGKREGVKRGHEGQGPGGEVCSTSRDRREARAPGQKGRKWSQISKGEII